MLYVLYALCCTFCCCCCCCFIYYESVAGLTQSTRSIQPIGCVCLPFYICTFAIVKNRVCFLTIVVSLCSWCCYYIAAAAAVIGCMLLLPLCCLCFALGSLSSSSLLLLLFRCCLASTLRLLRMVCVPMCTCVFEPAFYRWSLNARQSFSVRYGSIQHIFCIQFKHGNCYSSISILLSSCVHWTFSLWFCLSSKMFAVELFVVAVRSSLL